MVDNSLEMSSFIFSEKKNNKDSLLCAACFLSALTVKKNVIGGSISSALSEMLMNYLELKLIYFFFFFSSQSIS